MKKIGLLFIIVSTSISSSFGQNYKSIFGADTTKWNYVTTYGGADFIATAVYTAFSDTTINGDNFKKLYEDYLINNDLFGFIREDSVQGKVWLRVLNDTGTYLIMDLNLSLNDTFLFAYTNDYSEKYVVTETIHDSYGYRVKLLGTLNYMSIEFIESIGTSFIFHFIETPWTYGQLLCSYKDGNLEYDNPDFDTCYVPFTSNIPIYNSSEFNIYPNPTNDVLTISWTGNNVNNNSVRLFDFTGKLVYQNIQCLPVMNIDTRKYPSGIYLLVLNEIFSKKIIINAR